MCVCVCVCMYVCMCVCVRTRVHCLMCKNIEKSIIYIYIA